MSKKLKNLSFEASQFNCATSLSLCCWSFLVSQPQGRADTSPYSHIDTTAATTRSRSDRDTSSMEDHSRSHNAVEGQYQSAPRRRDGGSSRCRRASSGLAVGTAATIPADDRRMGGDDSSGVGGDTFGAMLMRCQQVTKGSSLNFNFLLFFCTAFDD